MATFGVNVLLNNVVIGNGISKDVVDSALRRSDEREIFQKFLGSESFSGQKVQDLLVLEATRMADGLMERKVEIRQETLFDFVLSSLKAKNGSDLSLYDIIVRRIIEVNNPKYIKLHRLIDRGKFDGRLPFGYPDASKAAAGLLSVKIKDCLPKVKRDYLIKRNIESKVGEYAKLLFQGVNRFNLQGEDLVNYLRIVFDLESVKSDSAEGPNLLREYLAESIRENSKLTFYFIKCLRFCYPKGNRLKILTNLDSQVIEDKNGGVFLKTDETGMFRNILNFKKIFQDKGVDVEFVVVVADNDLADNFPNGFEAAIPPGDIMEANKSVDLYMENLRHGSIGDGVVRMSQLINGKGEGSNYEQIRNKVLSSLKRSDGKFVSESVIEGLVEYRFERDKVIFESITKEMSRERVYQKMSSQIALQVLAQKGVVLVTNSHGNENGFIAGRKMPVFFTDFYIEEKIFENI